MHDFEKIAYDAGVYQAQAELLTKLGFGLDDLESMYSGMGGSINDSSAQSIGNYATRASDYLGELGGNIGDAAAQAGSGIRGAANRVGEAYRDLPWYTRAGAQASHYGGKALDTLSGYQDRASSAVSPMFNFLPQGLFRGGVSKRDYGNALGQGRQSAYDTNMARHNLQQEQRNSFKNHGIPSWMSDYSPRIANARRNLEAQNEVSGSNFTNRLFGNQSTTYNDGSGNYRGTREPAAMQRPKM
jgi:hypothetical protein